MTEELRWKKFPVLSDGFICLVDWMGDDSSIVQAARISYGAGTKHTSDDRSLIRYLYRMAHSGPFEQVVFKFLVRMPMDSWRQFVRHRTLSINEYSTRYSEAIDSCDTTSVWRKQSQLNKQGSGDEVTEWPEGWTVEDGRKVFDEQGLLTHARLNPPVTPKDYLCKREADLQLIARSVYEERLAFGVAREQARKDLPLSTYTEAYFKVDLHNLLHFLSLRMDSHAQLEIRLYANTIYEIVKQICPIAIEAFDDYNFRRNGLLLSRMEVEIISKILVQNMLNHNYDLEADFDELSKNLGKTEKKEFLEKLAKLGIHIG